MKATVLAWRESWEFAESVKSAARFRGISRAAFIRSALISAMVAARESGWKTNGIPVSLDGRYKANKVQAQ